MIIIDDPGSIDRNIQLLFYLQSVRDSFSALME